MEDHVIKIVAGLLLALLSCSVVAETVASVGGGVQSIDGTKFGIGYFGTQDHNGLLYPKSGMGFASVVIRI